MSSLCTRDVAHASGVGGFHFLLPPRLPRPSFPGGAAICIAQGLFTKGLPLGLFTRCWLRKLLCNCA
eukprot:8485564-Pyramimonas_sp.AAC.1